MSVVVLQPWTSLHEVELIWWHTSFWMVVAAPPVLAVFVCMIGGWRQPWMDGKKREWKHSWLDGLTYSLTLSIHFFPTFSLSISSPPTYSHIEWGITSIISPYLSLSLSLPLHSGHSVPIEYACCGHEWVPQQSYHVLIRSILVARLILLHPFSPIIGQKPLPTCQQQPQYKCCNLFFTATGHLRSV